VTPVVAVAGFVFLAVGSDSVSVVAGFVAVAVIADFAFLVVDSGSVDSDSGCSDWTDFVLFADFPDFDSVADLLDCSVAI